MSTETEKRFRSGERELERTKNYIIGAYGIALVAFSVSIWALCISLEII